MNGCPQSIKLQQLLAHQLTDDEHRLLEAHLQSCSRCRAILNELAVADGPPTVFLEEHGGREPLTSSLGRYRLRLLLGRGGMGEVNLADDPELGRRVAVKRPIFFGPAVQQTLASQRFEREGRVAARVHHPHVCPIYDVGENDLARSLDHLGRLRHDRGDCDKAQGLCEEAGVMLRRCYPPQEYPAGHPNLARALADLGLVLHDRGEYRDTLGCLREAVTMSQGLFAAFADLAAEAEALNYAAQLPASQDLLLSTVHELKGPAEEVYPLLWKNRAAVARLLERRQQSLAQSTDETTRELAEKLRAARQRLACLLLAPPQGREGPGRSPARVDRREGKTGSEPRRPAARAAPPAGTRPPRPERPGRNPTGAIRLC